MFKAVSFTDGGGNINNVIYCEIDRRFIFLNLGDASSIVFAEDIIEAINDNECHDLGKTIARYFNLVPMMAKNEDYEDVPVFEFVEIVPDPDDWRCPIDFIHTKCPFRVREVFKKHLPSPPLQTYQQIASSKRYIPQPW